MQDLSQQATIQRRAPYNTANDYNEYDDDVITIAPQPVVRRASRGKQPVSNTAYQDRRTTGGLDGQKRTRITNPPAIREKRQERKPHQVKGWMISLEVVVVLASVYTLAYWCFALGLSAYNAFHYGSTYYTSNTDAEIGGKPTHITIVNEHGTVLITLFQHESNGHISSTSYQGPSLVPKAWGNDLSGIVATATFKASPYALYPTIQINLIGSPDYWHLFFYRPQASFVLAPNPSGQYIVQ